MQELGVSTGKHELGYVSLGPPSAFLSVLHGMIERGLEVTPSEEGSMSKVVFYSTMQSKDAAEVKLRVAQDRRRMSESEDCLEKNSKHQSAHTMKNGSRGRESQDEKTLNLAQVMVSMTEGLLTLLSLGEENQWKY